MSYKVKDYGSPKEVLLTWPRPFTWEEYPITGYHIVCWDTEPRYEKEINDNATLMAYNVSHTLDLDIPRCGQLPCNVTASNTLASSNVSTSTISIPRCEYLAHVLTHIHCIIFHCSKCLWRSHYFSKLHVSSIGQHCMRDEHSCL